MCGGALALAGEMRSPANRMEKPCADKRTQGLKYFATLEGVAATAAESTTGEASATTAAAATPES
jgi:hypothetical protein